MGYKSCRFFLNTFKPKKPWMELKTMPRSTPDFKSLLFSRLLSLNAHYDVEKVFDVFEIVPECSWSPLKVRPFKMRKCWSLVILLFSSTSLLCWEHSGYIYIWLSSKRLNQPKGSNFIVVPHMTPGTRGKVKGSVRKMICLELNWFFYDPRVECCNFLNLFFGMSRF